MCSNKVAGKRESEAPSFVRKQTGTVNAMQYKSVKSTSPVTENHNKNGYVNYKNFIMTNKDIINDTKYTNKHDTNNHNARDLLE